MPRPYKLVLECNSGKATVVHDGPSDTGTRVDLVAGDEVNPLYRRTYRGTERPHLKPDPYGRVTMTVAGVIALDNNSKIIVRSATKNDKDPTTVLIAEVDGGKLKVLAKEISIPKHRDKIKDTGKERESRKANFSRLRRNKRGAVVFYVWTRDQYRFTVRKGLLA